MSRLARWLLIVSSALSAAGCCNGIYGRLQDGWLWNNARVDWYPPNPPRPPRTTPPGPTTPASLPAPPGVN